MFSTIGSNGERIISTQSIFRGTLEFARSLGSQKQVGSNSALWLFDWLTRDSDRAKKMMVSLDDGRQRVEPNHEYILSEQAIAVLDRALDFSSRTIARNQISARHIVAALVVPGVSEIDRTVIFKESRELQVDLRSFVPVLREKILEKPEPSENAEVWRTILVVPAILTIPDYTADRPDAPKDTMNVGPDVEAFAQLICLKAVKPPMSIGLFGDWGSGKTFFMERLQTAIKDRANAAKPFAANTEHPFVSDVTQIRFNAWHYADSEIWACLTAEFFDQLRNGGFGCGGGAAYEELVGKVATHVNTLESAIAQGSDAATRLEKQVEAGKTELAENRAALRQTAPNVGRKHIGQALSKVFGQYRNQLNDIGEKVLDRRLGDDIEQFADCAQKSRGAIGQAKLIVGAIRPSGAGRWAWAAVAMTALFVVSLAFVHFGFGSFPPLPVLVSIGSLIGVVVAALPAINRVLGFIAPILEGVTAFTTDLEAKRATIESDLISKEKELNELKKRSVENRAALDTAQHQLAPYKGGPTGSSQAALLRFFLFEDDSTKEYANHLGLVSRARHSFETLDKIVSNSRRARQAKARVVDREFRDIKPTEAETAKFAEDDRLAKEYDANFPVPDRIVIYIDDLDRCTHKQVYNVLQAVHLLLAFEVFVVVVGVDVRWIHGAVAKHFEGDSSSFSTKGEHTRIEVPQQKPGNEGDRFGSPGAPSDHDLERDRSMNYLEKIFQIPFWLRPLKWAADGGNYRTFVDDLLQANVLNRADAQGTIVTLAKETLQTPAAGSGSQDRPPAEVLADPEEVPRIVLTPAEVEFLASPTVAMLAGNSPRTVKRFVNLYRLVRARRTGVALEEITGEQGGSKPSYPLLAFLVALESGQRSDLVARFHRALADMPDTETLSNASAFLAGEGLGNTTPNGQGLLQLSDLGALLKEVDAERNTSTTASEYRKYVDDVRRFSFHRVEGVL